MSAYDNFIDDLPVAVVMPEIGEQRCCPTCLAVVRLVKTSDLPVDRVVHNPACPECGQAIPPRKD